MNITVLILLISLLFFGLAICKNRSEETFDIPLRSSSAWDWNLGPGYGAGYGTGYAMWGIWPSDLPSVPCRNWMWGRRPLIFVKPFTPVPQIDYNDAPDNDSGMVSNYNVSILPNGGRNKLAINGFPGRTMQLDRGRNYYFHVYTPGAAFVVTDGNRNYFTPMETGTIQMMFDESDPDKLYYIIPGDSGSGGVIYLNSIKR